MPVYVFKNVETDEFHEKLMSFSAREEYLKENPNLISVPAIASVGDPVRMGMQKPAEGYRDLLKTIKSKHRGSTINTW